MHEYSREIQRTNNMEETLRTQLSELEILQSMFSNSGEFCVDDHSILADINEFLDGKSSFIPPRLDFSINILIDKIKLELCVNLPHEYPAVEPDLFVRSNELNRTQQHKLNSDLADFISNLERGEVCILSAVLWLQEKEADYYSTELPTPSPVSCQDIDQQFVRLWIYSHHIYGKAKRREMLSLAHEYCISGFCLPGKPGIICVEGVAKDCEEWWQQVKCMNWKRIICKKKEVQTLSSEGNIDELRRFPAFQEVVFEGSKTRSNDGHMDMGELFVYLESHNSSYVFKDYFGVEGKSSLH